MTISVAFNTWMSGILGGAQPHALRLFVAPVLLFCLFGCGADGSPMPDGGGLADGGPRTDAAWLEITPPAPPAPPAEPAWPQLTPCPDGWREVELAGFEDDGFSVCDPWPSSGRQTCTGVDVHLPGESGCRAVGHPCPSGDYPEGLPTDASIRYVLAGTAGPGSGTRTEPFATIGRALSGAAAGTIIAIGKGRYGESLTLSGEVSLWGACASGVTVAPASGREAAITVTGGEVSLRGIGIEAGARAGIRVDGGRAHIDGVSVRDAEVVGVVVNGGRLEARELLIRDVRSRASDGRFGIGMDVQAGGGAVVERSSVERGRLAGVRCWQPGSSVVLRDVAIANTLGEAGRALGAGAVVVGGATLQMERTVLMGNRVEGLAVLEEGTSALVEDSFIEDTRSHALGGAGGLGARVTGGATLVMRRSLLRGNRNAALQLEFGAAGEIEDSVLLDTDVRASDSSAGIGLSLIDATLEGARVLIHRSRSAGLVLSRDGAFVRISDLRVTSTLGQPDGLAGQGIDVIDGAELEADRVLVEDAHQAGVFVRGSTARLQDVQVVGARPQGGGKLGVGVIFSEGSRGELVRAHLLDNRMSGLVASDTGTSVTVDDLTSVETGSDSEGNFGTGVHVSRGARMELRRADLRGNREAGIMVLEAGELDAEDLRISDTLPLARDDAFGDGLLVTESGRMDAIRVVLAGNQGGGLTAWGSGTRAVLSEAHIWDVPAREGRADEGMGVLAFGAATIELNQVLIEHARMVGVLADEVGSEVRFDGLELTQTVPDPISGIFGRGLNAQNGASIQGTRGRIRESTEFGVIAVGPGSVVALTETEIEGTRSGRCGEGLCEDGSFGVNAAAYDGGSVTMSGFDIWDAALCGVLVGQGSDLDLSLGEISGQPIGACVQHEGYDVTRLTESVRYTDNEQNLQSTTLPLPPPLQPTARE